MKTRIYATPAGKGLKGLHVWRQVKLLMLVVLLFYCYYVIIYNTWCFF